MVKLKQEDYVALHRIITNTSARVIWEHLAVNACKDQIAKPKHWPKALHIGPERAAAGPGCRGGLAGEDAARRPGEFYGLVPRDDRAADRRKVEVLRAEVDEHLHSTSTANTKVTGKASPWQFRDGQRLIIPVCCSSCWTAGTSPPTCGQPSIRRQRSRGASGRRMYRENQDPVLPLRA